MSTNFPSNLDNGVSLPYPSALSKRNGPSLAGLNDNQNDAVIATQTKLGTSASTPTASNLLVGTGFGTSSWSKLAPAGVIVGTTDTQTITNKTITSSTIINPVINNATLTTDSISGFTTPNSGSIYGIGVIASLLNGSSITNGSIAASKLGLSVASQINTGTAGGTLFYVNLGGIKLMWGITNGISTAGTAPQSASGFVNFPVFFSAIQTVYTNIHSAYNSSAIYAQTQAPSTTGMGVQVQSIAGTNGGSAVDWLVIGN